MYNLHLTRFMSLSLFFSVCWSVRGLKLKMRTRLTVRFSQSLWVFQTWVCWAPSAWAPVPPPAPAWPVTACLLMTTFELHPTTLDIQSFQTVCIHVTSSDTPSRAPRVVLFFFWREIRLKSRLNERTGQMDVCYLPYFEWVICCWTTPSGVNTQCMWVAGGIISSCLEFWLFPYEPIDTSALFTSQVCV